MWVTSTCVVEYFALVRALVRSTLTANDIMPSHSHPHHCVCLVTRLSFRCLQPISFPFVTLRLLSIIRFAAAKYLRGWILRTGSPHPHRQRSPVPTLTIASALSLHCLSALYIPSGTNPDETLRLRSAALLLLPTLWRLPPLISQINSIVGSAKEVVGNVIETGYSAVGGSKEPSSWTTAGKEQHAKGEAEIKAAEAKGYAEG